MFNIVERLKAIVYITPKEDGFYSATSDFINKFKNSD